MRAGVAPLRPAVAALVLFVIVLGAACLRFWRLDAIPPGYHYDEAIEGLEAWRTLTEPGYHPIFFSSNFGLDAMFIYLTALAFRLFGAEPVVQRGVAAMVGTLTVPAVWFLAQELRRWDRRLPLTLPIWAAAVQATLFWALHASRIGYEPGLVPLFLCGILVFLLAALRTGGMRAWLATGVLAGLALYTYPAARLIPLLLPLLLGMAWLLSRGPDAVRAHLSLRGVALLGLGGLLLFAPLGLHWWQNPDLLLLRSQQIAIVGEGQGSATPLQTFLAHGRATLGMFSVAGDTDPRNNLPDRPVFDPFLAPFFYLGLLLALRGVRRLPAALILVTLAAMLAPTLFSEYAPHFRRAIGAIPFCSLLAGWGLGAAWEWVPRAGLPWNRLKQGAVVLLLLASTIVTIRDYFREWATSPALYYAFDEGLWRLAEAINALPQPTRTYLTPLSLSNTTLAFAWREGGAPATFDGRHIFVIPPDLEQPVVYATVSYEDFRTPLLLPELFPQAEVAMQLNDWAGAPYATLYRVPAGSTPHFQPETPSGAVWEGKAHLHGFTLAPVYRPGETVYLRLFWEGLAPIEEAWTGFVHLLDEGGQNVLGADQQPGRGSYPTTQWQPGERLLDEVQVIVPPDFPPGTYTVELGFYRADGSRPLVKVGDASPADHLILGQLRIVAPP